MGYVQYLGVRSNFDPTIFIWRTNKTLKDIMCSHVDDFFSMKGMKILKGMYVVERLKEKLEVGCEEKFSFNILE